MIIYSKEGNKIIIKAIFEIENISEDRDINKIIVYGLRKLATQVEENRIKIYDSKEIGVF